MASKDGYHHGDLRRALMDGALALVRERGLQALSLREVASQAGVSAAAPYHHFADKAALVRALGFEALGELDRRMAAAESAAPDDSLERLFAIGGAYVRFALERPDYAAVMRAPEMAEPAATHDQAEHGESWERLVRAVDTCQKAGVLAAGDPMPLTLGMWALVQGLAELLTSPGAADGVPGDPDAFADSVLRAMVPRATSAAPPAPPV